MMKVITLLGMSLVLSSCATVGNVVVKDQILQTKAAFALNTTSDKVKISNRVGGITTLDFVATVGKKSHQCYVTTFGGVVSSDAICSGSSSVQPKKTDTSCNALLKAAGHC